MTDSNRSRKLCNLNDQRTSWSSSVNGFILPQLYAFARRDVLLECQDELRFISKYRGRPIRWPTDRAVADIRRGINAEHDVG